MKEDDSRAGGLFRHEFLDRGLVTFVECSRYYAEFAADALMTEMRLLFSPPMLAIPFGVAGTRYYALMDALIHCAGEDMVLSDRERTKLVNICIDVCTFLRSRAGERRRHIYAHALSAALDRVALSGRFPHVAALIGQGIRDYDGPYERGAVDAMPQPLRRRGSGHRDAARQVA